MVYCVSTAEGVLGSLLQVIPEPLWSPGPEIQGLALGSFIRQQFPDAVCSAVAASRILLPACESRHYFLTEYREQLNVVQEDGTEPSASSFSSWIVSLYNFSADPAKVFAASLFLLPSSRAGCG